MTAEALLKLRFRYEALLLKPPLDSIHDDADLDQWVINSERPFGS
jgi:hypothetical protein